MWGMRTTSLIATLAALAAMLIIAAPASALTLVRADGHTPIPRYQKIVDRAGVPTFPGRVRVVFGQEATHYWPSPRTVYVARGMKLNAETLLHELGHDFERHGLTTAGWHDWATQVGETLGRDVRVNVAHIGPRWLAIEHFAEWYTACGTRGRIWRRVGRDVVDRYGGRMKRTAAVASCRAIFRLDASGTGFYAAEAD